MNETPSITAGCYASSNLTLDQLQNYGGRILNLPDWGNVQNPFQALANQQPQQQIQEIMAATQRRYVQVFIADTNENVPLEESVIFKGDQKLTDLTDTELFFEVPIAQRRQQEVWKRCVSGPGKDSRFEDGGRYYCSILEQ